MKTRLFTLLAAGLCALGVQAQFQLTNAGFEEWQAVSSGEEPLAWSSFVTGTGSLKSIAGKCQIEKDGETLHTGEYSAKLTSRTIMGVPAQGNLTTGTINMGSMTATDASGNFNYVCTEPNSYTDTPRPGHAFTGHPDALRVWVKYNSAAEKVGQVRAMLLTEGYYQDPLSDKNPVTATLVAIASNTAIAHSEDWQELLIPFEWQDTDAEPAYAFINIATCSTPGGGHKDDVMWVDDLEMLYYSELFALTYDGVAVEGDQLPCTPKMFDPDKLAVTSGHAAKVNCEVVDGQLVITIQGEDIEENPANTHAYTYSFLPVESKMLSLQYDGQTINGDILPCVKGVFDASLLQPELSAGASYTAELTEEGLLVITVLDENGENPTVYTYSFVTVGSELLTLTYDGKRVYGTVLPCGFSAFDATLVACTLSEGAAAELGEATAEEGLTITVKGSDFDTNPDNFHVYTYTFDKLSDLAEPVEVADWSEMQKYYVANMDENGKCDFTSFIVNPDIENGEEGWELNGFAVGATPASRGIESNSLLFYVTDAPVAGETASQTIAGMPAGNYNLSFSYFSAYAKKGTFGGESWSVQSSFVYFIDEQKHEYKKTSVATASISNTLAEEGDLTITIANDGSSSSRTKILVQYDNFRLAYSHPNYKLIAELLKYDQLVAEKNNETFTNMYNNLVQEVRATAWDLTDNSENIGVIAEAYNLLSETKHSVFFVSDGNVFQSADLACGETVAAPEAEPAKEGHTFKGWDAEPAATMGMEDLVYEAVWEVNQYTLAYTVDGEAYGETETLDYGTALTLRDEPQKEGYTFSGWSELPETMPAEDVTISGTFTVNTYTLTFAIGEEIVGETTVAYGEALPVAPEAPELEGHTFAGWSEQPETMPAADVTITGSYTVNSYTVTWTVNGTEVYTETYEYGATIAGFGYEFDPACEYSAWEGYTEGMTMPAADQTFNMTETRVYFTVTYKQGEQETAVVVKVGETIALPELADEGWSWMVQTEDGLAEVPEAMPAADVTLVVFIPVGIDRVTTAETDSFYTLGGVRLNTQPRQGLYIRNGKKVLLRK